MEKSHGHKESFGGGRSNNQGPISSGRSQNSKLTTHDSGSSAAFTTGLALGVLASSRGPVRDRSSQCDKFSAREIQIEARCLADSNERLRQYKLRLKQEAETQRRQAAEQANVALHQALLPRNVYEYERGDIRQIDIQELDKLSPLTKSSTIPTYGIIMTLPYLALTHDREDLFALAINQKGYPLNLPNHASCNPLVYICEKPNAREILDSVKNKITMDDADVLITTISNRMDTKQPPSDGDFQILSWLLQNGRVSKKHSDWFNQLAIQKANVDPSFSSAVFSNKYLCVFPGNDDSTRYEMLGTIRPDNNTFLNWYSATPNFIFSQKLCNDLFSTYGNYDTTYKRMLQLMTTAANQKLCFEALELPCLERLINSYSTDSKVIINHLIETQPLMFKDLNDDCKKQLNVIYQDVYQKMFDNMTGAINAESNPKQKQKNILQREKKLLSLIHDAFKNQSNAHDIRTLALRLEQEWKDAGFSPRSIEVMLKLAKSEILLRVRDGFSPSTEVANFMAKNRTTHHFFCMPFQLTMFSTSSTKAYNLFCQPDKFYAAVDQEVERGEREFKAAMA